MDMAFIIFKLHDVLKSRQKLSLIHKFSSHGFFAISYLPILNNSGGLQNNKFMAIYSVLQILRIVSE